MGKQNTFQIVILLIFAVFAVVGVAFFATQKGQNNDAAFITLWGTEDETYMRNLIASAVTPSGVAEVDYVQKNEESFNTELVEAIAEGRGPDVIILGHGDILRHRAKISPFPFESVSERDFSDAFVDGASIFWTPEGYIGLPFSVDPMVMYWNKSLFINEGVIRAPSYWDEFANLSLKLTKKDSSFNIFQSFVALGEYANISNAKEIIGMLMMQAGTPIVSWGADGSVQNYLRITNRDGLVAADVAMRFYTEFADPAKATYSWNRSLPESQKAFVSGNLAVYLGFASEVEKIRSANPNLNFDVSVVPQIRDGLERSVYGDFKAAVVMRTSKNTPAAYGVASMLASREAAQFITETTTLPPVHKTLLEDRPLDPYRVVFYDSALVSRAWLDPNKSETDDLFKEMVGDITSGRSRLSDSVNRSSDIMDSLVK